VGGRYKGAGPASHCGFRVTTTPTLRLSHLQTTSCEEVCIADYGSRISSDCFSGLAHWNFTRLLVLLCVFLHRWRGRPATLRRVQHHAPFPFPFSYSFPLYCLFNRMSSSLPLLLLQVGARVFTPRIPVRMDAPTVLVLTRRRLIHHKLHEHYHFYTTTINRQDKQESR
jgi:hypothetical protein